jgi:hypothetical protein
LKIKKFSFDFLRREEKVRRRKEMSEESDKKLGKPATDYQIWRRKNREGIIEDPMSYGLRK